MPDGQGFFYVDIYPAFKNIARTSFKIPQETKINETGNTS